MKLNALQIDPNIVPEVPACSSQGATFKRHAKTPLHWLRPVETGSHRPAPSWNPRSGRSGPSIAIPEHLMVFHVC